MNPSLINKAQSAERFMREALKQAEMALSKNEVPVGAVITFENKIIAKAFNQVESLNDPTAHAEMIAITQATHTLGHKWLSESHMYVTLEPCSMCAGALVLARMKNIYIGAADSKTGACGSVLNIIDHVKLNHRVSVHQGLLADECVLMLSNFFKKKRLDQKDNAKYKDFLINPN